MSQLQYCYRWEVKEKLTSIRTKINLTMCGYVRGEKGRKEGRWRVKGSSLAVVGNFTVPTTASKQNSTSRSSWRNWTKETTKRLLNLLHRTENYKSISIYLKTAMRGTARVPEAYIKAGISPMCSEGLKYLCETCSGDVKWRTELSVKLKLLRFITLLGFKWW